MARRSAAPDVETVEAPAQTQALTTQTRRQNEAMAVYTGEGTDANDARGKENISREDIRLPRLAIAQKMSPEVEETNAKFIPDLELNDLFNSLTQEIYGQDPLEFVVLRCDKRAHVLDSEGKILERDIPWDDPRNQFTEAEEDDPRNKIKKGDRLKPIGTRFYDFIIMLVETSELIVLSMKNTQVPEAKKLLTFMSLRPGASWAGKYTVKPVSQTKGDKTWGNYRIALSGPSDKATFERAAQFYDAINAVNVTVDRDTEVDGAAEGSAADEKRF